LIRAKVLNGLLVTIGLPGKNDQSQLTGVSAKFLQ
jgi:hypothetical protein